MRVLARKIYPVSVHYAGCGGCKAATEARKRTQEEIRKMTRPSSHAQFGLPLSGLGAKKKA